MKTWTVHGQSGALRLHRKRPCRWLPRGRGQFYLRHWQRVYLLTFRPWLGICVVAMWDMKLKVSVLDPPAWQWEFPNMKKRTAVSPGDGGQHRAALESVIFGGLLPLVEHCAVTRYDDGDPRQPGWITIKTQGVGWVVQVKDPDGACSFQAIAETLDKALETAALLLACDEAPWEPDRFLASNGKKKK